MIKGVALKRLQMSLFGPGFVAARHIAAVRRPGDVAALARADPGCAAAPLRAARETNIPRFLTAKLPCNTLRAMQLRATPPHRPRRAGLAPFD
ncbi:MAG TPA: hypothetical protein VGR92_15865 [Steroidobacteraceae bacterium]|nr:hypothetical protein [Steroidobacteraceae bacterium]